MGEKLINWDNLHLGHLVVMVVSAVFLVLVVYAVTSTLDNATKGHFTLSGKSYKCMEVKNEVLPHLR